MKRTDAKITRYTDGKYTVDIEQNGSSFDAWIGHKDFGVRSYMFGKENTTEEQFLHVVTAVLKEYEKQYREDYEF